MGETRLISIVGRKNAGKTTLVVAMAADFSRRGRKVGTIKHGMTPAQMDTEGTDTWRHYNEGNADRVLIEGPDQRIMIDRSQHEEGPVSLAERYFTDCDIVIVEGFKRHDIPKIEVYRTGLTEPTVYSEADDLKSNWIAVVTDLDDLQVPVPTFRFKDTAWLVSLTGLAWSSGKVLRQG
ncbi:MAG: molybdopterin-guanine dinucleotide biosynthesis protein B [Gemmatimonadales bacterium]